MNMIECDIENMSVMIDKIQNAPIVLIDMQLKHWYAWKQKNGHSQSVQDKITTLKIQKKNLKHFFN